MSIIRIPHPNNYCNLDDIIIFPCGCRFCFVGVSIGEDNLWKEQFEICMTQDYIIQLSCEFKYNDECGIDYEQDTNPFTGEQDNAEWFFNYSNEVAYWHIQKYGEIPHNESDISPSGHPYGGG